MLTKNLSYLFLSTVLAVGISGCASKAPKNKDKSTGVEDSASVNTEGAEEISRFRGEENWDSKTRDLMAKRVYRFGFDKFDVASEDYSAIEAHADYLKAHPEAHVRIEGHTDEQGSREYNIGLGERRAKAVREIMNAKGVSPKQYDIVSFGMEKPEASGKDESAFSINRRAALAYEKN
jgi:peptidoglycan-associated lipoprotein